MAGSRLPRRAGAAAALTLAVAAAAIGPAGANGADRAAHPATSSKARVLVLDNRFANSRSLRSTRVSVRRRGTVTWSWGRGTAEPHNVVFTSAPRGARRPSRSRTTTRGTFRARLTRTGTYRYVCTIHVADGMRGSVTVRRR